MPLVPAKCTQCGGNIEVDSSKDAGICKYCGTAFIIEKEINNYNTYGTNNFEGANITVLGGNVENLLKMAENAENAGNPDDANKYYSKALEFEPYNRKALFGKGCTSLLSRNTKDINVNELLTYATKSLNGCDDNEFILFVMKKLHEKALNVYKGAIAFYNQNWKFQSSFDSFINGLEASLHIGLLMKNEIAEKNLINNKEIRFYYTESIVICIICCVELCEERKYVSSVTSGNFFSTENTSSIKISKTKHEIFLKIYDEMCSMVNGFVPDYEKPDINRQIEVSGCYIATCLYGSYDCPEVWTLRRFRDYTLDETWYGRLFIKCYYATSPTLVKWFGEKKWFRSYWKSKLDKMVSKLNDKGVDNKYYIDKY